MKSLRQLFRRKRHQRSSEQQNSKAKTGNQKRRLSAEALERRQLLAGDIGLEGVTFGPENELHNYAIPTDANRDWKTTAGDALVIINHINRERSGGALAEQVTSSGKTILPDTNNDGKVTAGDALRAINAAGGEGQGEIVELLLMARDLNDQLLDTNSSGQIDVGTELNVNESFFLEVSYNDLRTFGNDTGVFKLAVDVVANMGNNIRPVLREFQELTVGEEVMTATTGELIFGLEGSANTVSSSLSAFGSDPTGEVRAAVATLTGFTTDQFVVSSIPAPGDDLAFEVFFNDSSFGNMDIPDLTLTSNFDVTVPVSVDEFAPFEADGTTPNTLAVARNFDARSRTFNNNSEFYNTLRRGDFDLATGFDEIGAVGLVPTGGGGIPELSNNGTFTEPFDALAIEVFLSSAPAQNAPLIVSVNPGESNENMLVYGNDDPVPASMILTDDDASVTFVSTSANNAPTATAITRTFSENDNQTVVDLLSTAADADGDTLSVTNVSTQGVVTGISISGSDVTVTPSAYSSLNTGQSEVITITYDITDGMATIQNTATITINGADAPNQSPTVSAPVTATFTEDDQPAQVNLLANASDPDGDTLTVTNLTVQSGDNSGITFDANNNLLDVTPQAYGSLNDGQSAVVVYNYTVSDGRGGTVNTMATVTITGVTDPVNNAPQVSGPVLRTFTEDDANGSVNLLANATDADGDTLSAINVQPVSGNNSGIMFNSTTNELDVVPSTYNSLAAGSSEVVTYTYQVTDGSSNVNASATITITGVNDNPTVSGVISRTLDEDDSATTIDMLTGASDPDATDTLNVDGNTVSITGDPSSAVSVSGNTISVDPSVYSALNSGQSANISVSYNIVDGNGGSVARSASITINGLDDNQNPTVSQAITATTNEDAATLNVNLLQFASDPDGDTLNVSGVNLSGDTAGASVSGNTLVINPAAYGALNQGQSATVTATYQVVDGRGGSVNQTATVTIEGRDDAFNNPPVVSAPITSSFDEDDAASTISLLLNASDADGDTLSVTNVSISNDPNNGVAVNGNNVTVTPSAYNGLNTGQNQVITVNYQVSDGQDSVSTSATFTIVGENETGVPGSRVSGNLFIDNVENLDEIIHNNADPIRNGRRDADESGLSGIPVRLVPNNGNGAGTMEVWSDINGIYEFNDVAPGTYTVVYDIPDSVMFSGSTTSQVTIGSAGGEDVTGGNLASTGLTGEMLNLDILAAAYLRAGIINSSLMTDDGVLQGGDVALGTSGGLELLVIGDGYDGIKFAELALNDARDSALLTIIDGNNDVKTARLDSTQFVVTKDGGAAKFFGGIEDHHFVDDVDAIVEAEFPTYRDAVDQVLGTLDN